MTPLTAFQRLNSKTIRRGLENAREAGYSVVYTSALMDQEIHGFLQSGFTIKEQLHILRHSLEMRPQAPEVASIKIRKPTHREIAAVVEVDKRCFDSFWTMDADGLREAIEATTRARFRVAIHHVEPVRSEIVGYAITGLGDRKGYLQRLAVDPSFQRQGIARQLVCDGFEWLHFWRAREEYVNTQTSNETALKFYLRMGFELLNERLNILQFDLGA